jgi:outer membrane protein OmpA-like peptidoglycan-associated protein
VGCTIVFFLVFFHDWGERAADRPKTPSPQPEQRVLAIRRLLLCIVSNALSPSSGKPDDGRDVMEEGTALSQNSDSPRVSALERRSFIGGAAAFAGFMGVAGPAVAQTDGNLTRILRDLAPHDRAQQTGAPRRRAAPRQLRTRGGGTVIVDYSRKVDVTVFFDLNSSTIRPDGRAMLLGLSRALNNPVLADQQFLIAGHTSADGDYDFNVALSHDRANSVRDWLIAYGEVSPGRLRANGFGPDLPRNARAPESPVNRRVEIIAVTG